MKKKLVLLLFVALCFTQANELEFGYSESNTSVVKNVQYRSGFSALGLDYSTLTKYRETESGHLINFSANMGKQITETIDIFGFGNFTNDTVLNINNRIDFGIGSGLKFYNDSINSHNLNSLRYKYTFKSMLLNIRAVYFYITPHEELQAELLTEILISANLTLPFKHEFSSKDGKTNFLSTAGLKIKWD